MSRAADLNLQPRRPAWGVPVPVRKSRSTARPIRAAALPETAVISLRQSGLVAEAAVGVGARVRTGEPIAEPANGRGVRVHASIAGTVVAIVSRPVADRHATASPCIVIRNDGTDERWEGYRRLDPEMLTPTEICTWIQQAGILGLGGALFPTALKLSRATQAELLILNGAECEPYISCDEMLMRERAAEVIAGARIMLRATGIPRCVIAIKNNMPEARIALRDALEMAGDSRFVLAQVTARYPAGGERQLIEMITGREVPSGGLPFDVGCLCQNVATAAAVTGFFAEGKPLIERLITITGGAISEPVNFSARLGTPLRELVAQAGGYSSRPHRLILGGPMMGHRLPDDELPVTPASNCIIAATESELPAPGPEQPCVRCGACAEACPARLLPQELLRASRRQESGLLFELGVRDCIECGACDYVCPSFIPLTRQFVVAKELLATAIARDARSAHLRRRSEARTARTGREERARIEALEAHTRKLDESIREAGPAALDRLLQDKGPSA